MTPNETVAQVAHELLDPGPMGWKNRRADYLAFCEHNFINGGGSGVFGTKGTNCALFVRGCWVQAGVKQQGARPAITGITSWIGVGWFKPTEGFATSALENGSEVLLPGDCLYWCGGRGSIWNTRWKEATNGHVGLVGFDGEGWVHTTYEGGGANHTCRKSKEPKDIRLSHERPLRWIWRPNWLVTPEAA